MSTFFNIYEEQGLTYYQLPKVFFQNEKYMNMSNDTKIAWSILKDRFQLSIKNNWFDENGNIYFIYTNDDLMDILNIKSPNKISKIKKELTEADLLYQVRVGLNKPNKLYIKKPLASDDDIYKIKKENDPESLGDKDLSKSYVRKYENDSSRNMKMIHQEVSKSYGNKTEYSKTDMNNTIVNNNVNNSSSETMNTYEIEKEYIQEGLSPELIQRVKDEIANKQEPVRHYEAYLRTCLDNTLHKHRLKRGVIDQPYPHLPANHPLNYNWLQDGS
ncbi:replication initiator protein A [uncultured Marinococcus sp.]|uniref:replication initiator protein A n=1 Tax=uncultured Marinococcus sp. TaxID=487012 RepID=UPI0026085E19|nr:replication initiator protein A [uncultured Marinococcus sp.]